MKKYKGAKIMNNLTFTKEEKQLMKRGGVVYNKNGYDYCISNKRLMKRISNEDSIWESTE